MLLKESVQAIQQSTSVSEYPDVPASKVHWASPVDIGPWWLSSLWSLVYIALLPLQIIFPTSDLCVVAFCLSKSSDCHQIVNLQKLRRHRRSVGLQISFPCSEPALYVMNHVSFISKNWKDRKVFHPSGHSPYENTGSWVQTTRHHL